MSEAPKKLYRNRSNKMLAGVCSGLADYLNVDVTMVRLIVVLIGVATGGAALLAYLIGAIIIPPKPVV